MRCGAYINSPGNQRPGNQRRCTKEEVRSSGFCDEHRLVSSEGEMSLKDQDEIVAATLEDQLTNWWMRVAQEEAAKVVPKAIEYGATDLAEIGRQMAAAGVHEPVGFGSREDAWYAELGIYFYLVGKLARWTDAVANGRQVSDDTLHDIGVYVRMAQRIRETGGWPNA